MRVHKVASFKSPEGRFSARVYDIGTKTDHRGEGTRIILELDIKNPVYTYLVATTYRPEDTVKFIPTLDALTGSKLQTVITEDGELIPEGLRALIGRSCDVEIQHVHSAKHDWPYCNVVQITRPGVLVPR